MSYQYLRSPVGGKEPIQRAIFLDVEGVVVTHRSVLANTSRKTKTVYHGASTPEWHKFVDPCAMGLVYLLANDQNATIVLSSTLRRDEHVFEGLIKVAPDWCKEDGISLLSAWVTPHSDKGSGDREGEIKKFVEDFKVEHYVVIDDRPLDGFGADFIRTDPMEGFTFINFLDATDRLTPRGHPVKTYPIFL